MPWLLERAEDLASLRGALDRAHDGRGSSVLVTGPAGIGKSRLLDALRESAGPGVRVLSARGGPLEQEFSFGIVRQLLERSLVDAGDDGRAALLSGPASLALPAVGPAPTAEPSGIDAAFAIRHGLYWLVSNLAAAEPLVLLVDDLHWADPPSLRALIHLVARLDGLPVLVVGARRTGEEGRATPLLGELERTATTTVRPAPLGEASSRQLVVDRLGAAPPALVRAVHTATGGNPFLLEALLRTLQADGLDAHTADPAAVELLGPSAVARALLLRIGRLPASCARVARSAAVLARHAEPRHVAAVAGLDTAATGAAIDALVAAEILRSGSPCEFLHPTMRAAVHDDTPPSARAAMHARAAQTLGRAGEPPGVLAAHLLLADPAGDRATVTTLRAAAAIAIGQGAPEQARRYLRRALREPPEDGSYAAVLTELGDTEWLAGEELDVAVEHLTDALERTTDLAERPQRALALHRALFAVGRVIDAVDLLEAELERIDGILDPDVVLRVEAELASIALLHPDTVGRAGTRLAAHERLPGRTPTELLQLANVACWKWARGTAEETVAFARRSLADARIQAADPSDAMPIYEALWALAHTDELELAGTVLKDTLADARARGSVFGITTSCSLLTLLALRAGDTATAVAEAHAAARLPGLSGFVRPPLFGYLARALVWRGDPDGAEQAIDESGCGPDLPEFVCLNPVFGARGHLRLAQGRIDEALADFRELGARSARVGLRNPEDGWRLGAVEALVRLDRRTEAVAVAREQLELAHAWGTTSAVGVAAHALAVAEDADVDAFVAAERTLAASSARLEHARCLVDLGVRLRHDGRRTEAREPLRRGLEMARRCGAEPLTRRAHDELLVAGARPRRLMFSGVDALTPSEQRVARMAADGRTNREIAQELFVTPKTVENQLGRVYGKLGVASRSALPEALRSDASPLPSPGSSVSLGGTDRGEPVRSSVGIPPHVRDPDGDVTVLPEAPRAPGTAPAPHGQSSVIG
ncbi:MAG: AAA family ATPase [Solirubrobacteraceae bacterium]